MLKNIAIPLILGAAEAEAQRGDWLEDAMEGDRGLKFEGLIANEAACSVEADADGIGAKATAEAAAKATLVAAEQAVAEAQTPDTGAWALADAARKAAVEAAVAQEASENIAGLLDALDEKANLERAAAADYLAADTPYQAGLAAATAAATAVTNAGTELTRLQGLQTVANQAVTDATAQIAKETLWRQYRFCELGAVPADDTTFTDWWKSDPATASDISAPEYCAVPAVMSEDGSTTLRPEIRYYSVKGNLPNGNDRTSDAARWSLWTATLEQAELLASETATESVGGNDRSKAAQILYYTGLVKRDTFINQQRTKEKVFYDELKSFNDAANAEATSESVTTDFTRTESVLGLGSSGNGAAKTASIAETARGTSGTGTTGRNYVMPAAGTDNQEVTSWAAVDKDSMDDWVAANSSTAGASYSWWLKAKDLSKAVSDWHVAYAAATTADVFDEESISADKSCVVTSYELATTVETTKAECKAKCTTQNNLLLNNPGAANGNVNTYGDFTQTIQYCGGYSFQVTSGSPDTYSCQLRFDSDTITENAGDTANGGSTCMKISGASALSVAQVAGKTALTAYTAQLRTDMITQTDEQAGLEQTWIQAEWIVLYWAAIVDKLTLINQSDRNPYLTKVASSLTTLGVTNNALNTNTGGAEVLRNAAASNLAAAEEKLIVLQSATAAKTAVVTDLGKRIVAATGELADLAELINDSTTGVLQLEAAARAADVTAMTTDITGTVAVLDAAKGEADAAVAADTPGNLLAVRTAAQTAWDTAATAVETANTELTTALDSADLAALRQTVAADTEAWEREQGTLDGLIVAVGTASTAYKTAAQETVQATTACQVAAYDAYRTTLERAMRERAEALKTIKALIQANEAARPAPGTVGARCEKALSNGTGRPQRGEQTCGGEGFCCGASRVWMSVGAGVADAAWRTIETCQALETTAYAYQPPRAPMDTTMPATVSVGFTCIEGAKTLAAAASALAAAVYMLA